MSNLVRIVQRDIFPRRRSLSLVEKRLINSWKNERTSIRWWTEFDHENRCMVSRSVTKGNVLLLHSRCWRNCCLLSFDDIITARRMIFYFDKIKFQRSVCHEWERERGKTTRLTNVFAPWLFLFLLSSVLHLLFYTRFVDSPIKFQHFTFIMNQLIVYLGNEVQRR